jgi:hypothetical protein
MRLSPGALARSKTGLNVRDSAGGKKVATLRAAVLVVVEGEPVNGWVRITARGWTQDGKTIYFEPDTRSGVKLTRGGWRWLEIMGWVAARYLDVVDGPE